MARVNTGVDPIYLADQHLIAEQVELLMVTGMLKKNNFAHKTPIPPKFKLGTGHITFWYDKLLYLQRRMVEVKKEIARRNFKVMEREILLDGFPQKYINDWSPSLDDSIIVRNRIVEKMRAKPDGFWRYYSVPIKDQQNFENRILDSDLFSV